MSAGTSDPRLRDDAPGELLEPEALELVASLGFATPRWTRVAGASDAAARAADPAFGGERIVVKAVVAGLAHKTERGAVAVVARRPDAVAAEVDAMARRLAGEHVVGFTLHAYVEHDAGPTGELLLGLRRTADFGPVVTVGSGGVAAELVARALGPGRDVAIVSPALDDDAVLRAVLGKPLLRAAVEGFRGRRAGIAPETLLERIRALLAFAASEGGRDVVEIEINPLALVGGEPLVLDALVRRATSPGPAAPPPRPMDRLSRMLLPERIGIVGVSERMNPGRVLLRNTIEAGFPRERIVVVKRDVDAVEGCRAVPDLASLPAPVDLLVLAIDAAQVPATVETAIELRTAGGILVIPGGLGEREGTGDAAARVRAALDVARATAWGGPVLNGGNCLGIRSGPGGYDTLFLPEAKMPRPTGGRARLALVSQSGALIAAKLTAMVAVEPTWLVSVGNQLDLTVGDYLTWLAGRDDVDVVSCYVEGFGPGDGARWLEAARTLVRDGRPVVLYRAGRTEAGARAGASHTASIAGDWAVTRELARAAGVSVAATLEEFEDLTRTFALLAGRRTRGRRLGAVSNAGFECVAVGDALGSLALASLAPETRARVSAVLERSRLERIVDAANPLDVTPIADDAAFADAARAVVEDDGVDVAVIGCVPMTPALSTLPRAAGAGEDLAGPDAVAGRLAALFHDTQKPLVVVVDGGAPYDPLVRSLEARGLPVFRTMDRAVRVLDAWTEASLGPLQRNRRT